MAPQARQTRITKRREDFKSLEAKAVDGLIVVAEDADVCSEVLELGLPRLNFGGRVCVPLAALQGAWRASGNFVDVRLTQLFTREFQALPLRTHPFMVADANLCEGFILCGSKAGPAHQKAAQKLSFENAKKWFSVASDCGNYDLTACHGGGVHPR
eukprot:s1169_g2.t1